MYPSTSTRRSLFVASMLLLVAVALAIWQNSRRPAPVALTPSLTGQVEYCLTCHADLPEISPSHPLQAFGCVVCHGGERLALDADLAHSSMRGGANPSSLQVVQASCGGDKCHSGPAVGERDHIQRVSTSIQATYAGAIATVRYTFGAQPDLTARLSAAALPSVDGKRLEVFDPAQETSPSVLAFARNCLTCHLSAEPLPGSEYARFTGCAACHTPTAGLDLTSPNRPPVHRLTTAISYTQCNTCHNRGNYDLRAMKFQPRSDHPSDRLHDYYQPIAQFVVCEWTLDCVDCHTRREAMGDGNLYNNKTEARYTRCATCHGTIEQLPLTRQITDPNDLALRMAFLNKVTDLKVGDTILVTERGEPLWNTRLLSDGTYELFTKVGGQHLTIRPVKGSACQQKVDEQESRYCHACHAVER